jgi:hypothetical protein
MELAVKANARENSGRGDLLQTIRHLGCVETSIPAGNTRPDENMIDNRPAVQVNRHLQVDDHLQRGAKE